MSDKELILRIMSIVSAHWERDTVINNVWVSPKGAKEIIDLVRADERERCVQAMKSEMESEHESVDFEQGYSSAHREAYMYCYKRMLDAIKSNTPEGE